MMAKSRVEPLIQEEVSDPQTNGVVREQQTPEAAAKPSAMFTREAFEAMREDEDMAPSLEEQDETYIPLGRPPKGYFTIHPQKAYELKYAFTYDFRKSTGKTDPYLVMRPVWAYFPSALIRIKRLVLCQTFEDEALRTWLWLADWFEDGETPSEFHKSVDRAIARGRQTWIQALFIGGIYQVRRWPESRLGQMPEPVWPDRDLFDILQETLQDRIIATPDHELIQAIGEEWR
jgi:hypothetical protein